MAQIAMVMSGHPGEGFELALTEPLGTGMFVTNVVVAGVILVSPMRRVRIHAPAFMKDVVFFSGAVAGVLALLMHGTMRSWQAALPAAYYVLYIGVTCVMSSGEEPMHADPAQHEVPLWRSTSFLDNVYALAPAHAMQ
eukprot:12982-Chlamydomonas_euryale.AAC.1